MEDCVVKVEIMIFNDSIPELRERFYVELESVDPLVSIATNRRSYVHIDIEDNDSELSDLQYCDHFSDTVFLFRANDWVC